MGEPAIDLMGLPDSGTRRAPSRAGWAALLVGTIVTGLLVWASSSVYDHNESRLLGLRVRDVGSVLQAVVPSVQTPLASAAELADATDGNAQRFRTLIAPYVGPGRQFASASLWPLTSAHLAPTVVVGETPELVSLPGQARAVFTNGKPTALFRVTGLLTSKSPRLGYEFRAPGVRGGFAVYAENPVPADRRSQYQSNSAFADLNYVLYLGRSQRASDLLVTSLSHFPITGRRATESVPFGDGVFTLVVTPVGSLGGAFFQRLPLIIAIVGLTLTLAAAAMTDRLVRRRHYAEQLAGVLDRVADENRKMYTEQRSIAQTLQHALLPEVPLELNGLQISTRYVPAGSGIDVGGDWYDIVAVNDRRVLLVIGDVSGHGLEAATTMASLRHAALAYAAEDAQPASVLAKLAGFVNRAPHGYFATVLCALADVDAHRLTVASAGHLPPLLLDGDESRFIAVDVGAPIGAPDQTPYGETVVSVAAHATLVTFTDGLVERRGEILDVGLARLRDAAMSAQLQLDDLVGKLASDQESDAHNDDTAIVGIRWQS